jgi:hypothetical protein
MGNKSLPFLGPTSLSISSTNEAMDGNLVAQEQKDGGCGGIGIIWSI